MRRMNFKPKPLPPDELTQALKQGIRDVPSATVVEEPLTTAPEQPPLRPSPPSDVPKRFTSFRLPVDLDEDLRAMIFETRRTKQDLLIEFVTAGIDLWKRQRSER
jgi:hypothetical protein